MLNQILANLFKNHFSPNIVHAKYNTVTVHAILTTIVQQTGTMNRSKEPLSTDNQQLNKTKLFLLSIVMHPRIDCNIFRERIMLKKTLLDDLYCYFFTHGSKFRFLIATIAIRPSSFQVFYNLLLNIFDPSFKLMWFFTSFL